MRDRKGEVFVVIVNWWTGYGIYRLHHQDGVQWPFRIWSAPNYNETEFQLLDVEKFEVSITQFEERRKPVPKVEVLKIRSLN